MDRAADPAADTAAGPAAGGFCGVVLAGGTAARMGGADKAAVELAGRPLLDHALDAFAEAGQVVVVGPDTVRTTRPVTFVVEDPPRGGPVAGLLAGVDALHEPRLVGVLAVDMPRVTAATMRRLREAATARDGAFLVGADGRRQLAGVLDAARLSVVRPRAGEQHGMALHRLLAGLDLATVEAVDEEAVDVDSWADLDRLRR